MIALDLTRFACALAVVVFHYAGWMPSLTGTGPATAPLRAGWIGVELFFVLSGVVIAWSAEGSAPMGFLARRALRLLPAAWVCASITALALLLDGDPARQVALRWFASMAFAPTGWQIDNSYWTLAIEVSFYLLIARVLCGGATLERLERIAIALGCASTTYWVATMIVDVLPMQNRAVQLLLLPHGCFFALGVLIRVAQRRGHDAQVVVPMIIFGAACTAEIVAHAREFPLGGGMTGWALAAFAAGLLPILCADRLQPWLADRVPARTAVMLGLMTYPLYLIHQQFGMVVVNALDAAGLWRWAALGLTAALCVALAWAIARWVEPAIRRKLIVAVNRRRGQAPDNLPTAFPSAG